LKSPNPTNTAAQRRIVEDLLGRLTLREKVSLLAGKDAWQTMDIPRLGIPSLLLTDGPHTVCAWSLYAAGQKSKTTCFPTGSAIGASWNPSLVEEVGRALGAETRGMGFDILLGPCINSAPR
jgi:beta-glucosidase